MRGYLKLTPWTRNALTPDEFAGLHERTLALGCLVNAIAVGPNGPWTVYASDSAVTASRQRVRGELAAVIHHVLDEYRDKRAAVDAEVAEIYAADELVQIQRQTLRGAA